MTTDAVLSTEFPAGLWSPHRVSRQARRTWPAESVHAATPGVPSVCPACLVRLDRLKGTVEVGGAGGRAGSASHTKHWSAPIRASARVDARSARWAGIMGA